jgi:DNA-binding GntR family transcriptional regulator
MTVQMILDIVAKMSYEDRVTIRNGIADMIVAKMSPEKIKEMRAALAESDAEIERGDTLGLEEARKRLGLP